MESAPSPSVPDTFLRHILTQDGVLRRYAMEAATVEAMTDWIVRNHTEEVHA